MDHALDRMFENSGCVVSFGSVRITDIYFANNAVILAKTTEVISEALESLREEAETVGLRAFWIKTKVQAFGGMQDATIESIPVSGENVELTQTFAYLGSVIHSSFGCGTEVNRRLSQPRSR